MKKQILSIGKALNKAEQKEIFGGARQLEEEGSGGNCWVSCKGGTMKRADDCDASADAMCNLTSWTSCSCWG